MNIVTCKDVSKSYPGNKLFRNFNLTLEEGKIYGLLGRNGAGKTTLLNLITNRAILPKGEIEIFGSNEIDREDLLLKTCYMSDYMKGFEGMSVGSILRRASKTYPNWDKKYAASLMDRFAISKKHVYGRISKGQTTCIGLIVAMASGCQLVILDEIYSGLDALVRKEFYDLLLEDYERTKRTFLISSHLIEEMDTLFTDIIMLKDGKIVVNESYEKLIEQSFVIMGRPEIIDYIPDSMVLDSERAENMIRIVACGPKCQQHFDKLRSMGARIEHASLQDIFIGMVSEE